MAPHDITLWNDRTNKDVMVPIQETNTGEAEAISESSVIGPSSMNMSDLKPLDTSALLTSISISRTLYDIRPDCVEDFDRPSHWPITRRSVHFIDSKFENASDDINGISTVVTEVHYRPYTLRSEIPSLFYSSMDISRFKREYRALVKASKKRMSSNRDESESNVDCGSGSALVGSDTMLDQSGASSSLEKSNSFWRTKVQRAKGRFDRGASLPVSKSSPKSIDSQDDEFFFNEEEECMQRTHSSSSHMGEGGIFSSVFDVAREAVSIFSGSSGSHNFSHSLNHSHQQSRKMSPVLQLVDTLYLF